MNVLPIVHPAGQSLWPRGAIRQPDAAAADGCRRAGRWKWHSCPSRRVRCFAGAAAIRAGGAAALRHRGRSFHLIESANRRAGAVPPFLRRRAGNRAMGDPGRRVRSREPGEVSHWATRACMRESSWRWRIPTSPACSVSHSVLWRARLHRAVARGGGAGLREAEPPAAGLRGGVAQVAVVAERPSRTRERRTKGISSRSWVGLNVIC